MGQMMIGVFLNEWSLGRCDTFWFSWDNGSWEGSTYRLWLWIMGHFTLVVDLPMISAMIWWWTPSGSTQTATPSQSKSQRRCTEKVPRRKKKSARFQPFPNHFPTIFPAHFFTLAPGRGASLRWNDPKRRRPWGCPDLPADGHDPQDHMSCIIYIHIYILYVTYVYIYIIYIYMLHVCEIF